MDSPRRKRELRQLHRNESDGSNMGDVGMATAAASSASSGTWDVDENDLLSYFLSAGEMSNSNLLVTHSEEVAGPASASASVTFRQSDAPDGGGNDHNAGDGEKETRISRSNNGDSGDNGRKGTGNVGASHSGKRRGPPLRQPDSPTSRGSAYQQPITGRGSGVFGQDGDLHMPVTPAVQFYANSGAGSSRGTPVQQLSPHASSHPGGYPPLASASTQASGASSLPPPSRIDSLSSSSSSSLSSMAAALVSGAGPAAVMQVHKQLQAQYKDASSSPIHLSHNSPISPAAMIGTPETMMLPPPPRFPSVNQSQSQSQSSQTQSIQTAQQQQQGQPLHCSHLEWIRQMNSMALMTGTSTSALGSGTILSHPGQSFVPQPTTPSHGAPQPLVAPNLPHQQQHHQNTAMTGHVAVSSTAQQPTAMLPSAAAASAILSHTHHASRFGGGAPVPESAEKRARRLARNRESARLSRRRKKERLLTLSEKVNKLHTEIDTERRSQLECMEEGLAKYRESLIANLRCTDHGDRNGGDGSSSHSNAAAAAAADEEETVNQISYLVQNTGPSCPVRRAAAAFQYAALKQLLIPKYQEFLLWLTTQDDSYFTAGKDERSKVMKASGRVSSKQIGEELKTAWKNGRSVGRKEDQENVSASGETRSAGAQNTSGESSNSTRSNLSCEAEFASQFWPLFAFEMSLSVDQEERWLQAQKRTRQMSNHARDRSQIAVAATMASNMKSGVLYQCHAAAHRNEMSLLHVLTPAQAEKYLKWLVQNKERCRRVLKKKESRVEVGTDSGDGKKEISLNDICKQLEEVLNIGKPGNC